ncbi:hypothetical protein GAO09_26585 [Rhizobiales bacterium RZME27]|uniref:Uncharacterized protein n=1 Tax=Endobacterium cereale TaxID=2663029 RepID=A0A6A8AIR3_9HYPH|nr:hypothetical protein [Endobacterium cereale]MQY49600.1 hypothetical protein [Endobacterium cereale]
MAICYPQREQKKCARSMFPISEAGKKMISIKSISDEVDPYSLGFIQFSDNGKMSGILHNRQMYILYIGASDCFDRMLRSVRENKSLSYYFEGGSLFNCKTKGSFIYIDYLGFSGEYSRAELFAACNSFFVQSFQALSAAGYGDDPVTEDLLLLAKSYEL